MWSREKLLHPATAIALVALFVSLGGVTYAAATIGTNQIKNGAVTNAKLKNGAVTAAKIRRSAISTSRLARGAVRGDKIARDGVTARELKDGVVTTTKLADGAITTSKLGLAAVGTTKLADKGVANGKLADGAVSVEKLGDRAVTGAKLADGAVTADKLGDGAITAAKLAPGTVVGGTGQLLSARVPLRDGASAVELLALPGVGRLQATCVAGEATTSFANTTTQTIDVQATGVDDNAPNDRANVLRGSLVAGASLTAPNGSVLTAVQSVSWQASLSTAAGVSHVATAWITLGPGDANGCVVTVQALAS